MIPEWLCNVPAPRFAAIKSGSTEPVSFSICTFSGQNSAFFFGAMEDIRNDKHLAMDLYVLYTLEVNHHHFKNGGSFWIMINSCYEKCGS